MGINMLVVKEGVGLLTTGITGRTEAELAVTWCLPCPQHQGPHYSRLPSLFSLIHTSVLFSVSKEHKAPLLRPRAQRKRHRESNAVAPSLRGMSLKSKSECQECLTEQSVLITKSQWGCSTAVLISLLCFKKGDWKKGEKEGTYYYIL